MFLRGKQKQNHHLDPDDGVPSSDQRRRKIQARIFDLKKQIRYSKWWTALFFLISLAAAVNFRFLPPITENIRQFLGASPSPSLISIALIVYAFSALILILGRMNTASVHYRGWSHIGYLSAFYLFFYYSNTLRDNFWTVFIAGLTILSLENYRVWSVCSEAIKNEEKMLTFMDR
ncbi:MAG: menaquinol oxidoreductase [Deltaproteobacteria bacterium]|nr:menaquinol oxidoreductase [Candidatus Tharpella aukensis]